MKKLAAIAAAVGLALFSLTGCAQSGVKTSAEATPENPMVLTLAHGLSETHTVHIAMTEFAEKVKERTDGIHDMIKIFCAVKNIRKSECVVGFIISCKTRSRHLCHGDNTGHQLFHVFIFRS